MELPEQLAQALAAADEEYLTALCNRGIFHRAQKDLAAQENGISAAPSPGGAVYVKCSGVTCRICAPLGQSSCSCPSPSMCRHRITAMLWLQAHALPAAQGTAASISAAPVAGAVGDAPQSAAAPAPAAPAAGAAGGDAPQSAAAPVSAAPASGVAGAAPQSVPAAPAAGAAGDAPQSAAAPVPAAPQGGRFASLLAYPPEKLYRQLGPKRLAELARRAQAGLLPALQEGTAVQVALPWVPVTVHLLEPLENSSCSCRTPGWCVHRAEALLLFLLAHGVVTPAELCPAEKEAPAPDAEPVAAACTAVRRMLADQLTEGLSRMPASVCETVERMASQCHAAGLPALERRLRALGGGYAAYFARSAAFRDSEQLCRLAECDALADALLRASDAAARRALAGVFHAEYIDVGTLELYAVGLREFSDRGGYAGTVCYFWEKRQARWYTYTAARPTYYESARAPRTAGAPWGLSGLLGQLCGMRLRLENAKATADGRLSAAEQSHAVLLDAANAGREIAPRAVYTDFARLLADCGAAGLPETKRVACVRAARCHVPDYDAVRQVFSLVLYDEAGRDLFVEVRYRQQEKQTVEVLTRLAARLKSLPDELPVFFGSVYTENSRLKLYPIEFFTDWEDAQ